MIITHHNFLFSQFFGPSADAADPNLYISIFCFSRHNQKTSRAQNRKNHTQICRVDPTTSIDMPLKWQLFFFTKKSLRTEVGRLRRSTEFPKVETLDLEKWPSHRTSRVHSRTRAKKLVWKAERTAPQLNYKALLWRISVKNPAGGTVTGYQF